MAIHLDKCTTADMDKEFSCMIEPKNFLKRWKSLLDMIKNGLVRQHIHLEKCTNILGLINIYYYFCRVEIEALIQA